MNASHLLAGRAYPPFDMDEIKKMADPSRDRP